MTKPFSRAYTWWLAAALELLPVGAVAAEPAIEVRVRCPQLEASREQRAELEARALVELSVRRRSSGALLVSCDADSAELSWTSAGREVTARVPLQSDPRLLVDSLIAALWNLTAAPEPPPPPPPAPAPKPTRPLAAGPYLGGRVELWPRAPNVFPGLSGGLQLVGRGWAASAFAQFAAALDDPEGLHSRMLGGGAALELRPRALGPLALGVGASAWRFSVKAPVPLLPDERSTLTVAALGRVRFVQEWQSFTLALGPELLVYPVRARVLVSGREALLGPRVAGAFSLELGWLAWR
jgi:hypothetical protein